jgi:ribosomal protein L37AE/L43A
MIRHFCPYCGVELIKTALLDVWGCRACKETWWLPHFGMTPMVGKELFPKATGMAVSE